MILIALFVYSETENSVPFSSGIDKKKYYMLISMSPAMFLKRQFYRTVS